MGAQEAQRVVDGAVGDELHVLRGADVLAEVDLVEAELAGVVGVVRRAAREVFVRRVGRDLPGQQARRDGHDLVALGVGAERHGEGQHRVVLARGVVLEREALGERAADILLGVATVLGRVLAEELGVAAGHVARAHDVAEHEHVLRLGDDGLCVAGLRTQGQCTVSEAPGRQQEAALVMQLLT